MATAAKKTASKGTAPRTRKELTPQAAKNPMPAATLMAATGPITAESAAKEADEAGEAVVIANVPRPFRLTLDNHVEVAYEHTGAVLMPRAHATHWYAEANGVSISKEL